MIEASIRTARTAPVPSSLTNTIAEIEKRTTANSSAAASSKRRSSG
jgi:hypothetical protein